MAPKLLNISLKDYEPSSEDVAEARKYLATLDSKAKKAKDASFAHFLQKKGLGDLAESRGEARSEWLVRFQAATMSHDRAKKTVETTKSSQKSKERIHDIIEVGAEEMDKRFGEQRGQHLRASGMIKSIPCPLTGSTEDHAVIWMVPTSLTRNANLDLDVTANKTSNEITAEAFTEDRHLTPSGWMHRPNFDPVVVVVYLVCDADFGIASQIHNNDY